TTGYDALAVVTHLFVDPVGGGRLLEAFADVAEVDEGWGEASARARRELLAGPLVADVDRLARLAHAVCLEDPRLRDHSLRGLTEAVLELLAEVPVYRAYVEPGRPAPGTSVSLLEGAAEAATARVPHRAREVGLLRDLALSRLGRSARKDELCVRFQQTSGPAMAKGVEDTACYRWFPLTSLAEVGVRPDRFGTGVRDLHAWASARVDRSPYAMSTLSTHDT